MGPVASVIAAVATVGSTAASINAQKRATRAQVGIAQQQQQQQELAYRRQQRATIREAQVRRSQGMATSQAAGVVGSSVAGGGAASIGSQAGSALGFGSQLSGLSSNITNLGISASGFQQQANMFSSLAQIGGNVFQATDGPARFKKWFG